MPLLITLITLPINPNFNKRSNLALKFIKKLIDFCLQQFRFYEVTEKYQPKFKY